jgi:hypothetical protein
MKYTLRKKIQSRYVKTRKHKKQENITPLRSYYGTITLPQGLQLYHVTDNMFCELPENPVFFLTLHPSDFHTSENNIAVVELLRSVSLVFLIENLKTLRLYSAINRLLNIPRGNIRKMETKYLKEWMPHLQKEHLDGWLSSIEGKATIEFFIINTPGTLKLIECKIGEPDWMNSYYENGELILKNWGSLYPIKSLDIPITAHLHSRYKHIIEHYMANIESQEPNGTTLYMLLKNAHITYFDSNTPLVKWV